MSITVPTILNVQALLISISLIILSILNFYFTTHGMKIMTDWFPAGSYPWVLPGSRYGAGHSDHSVLLTYDYSPENGILVSTAFSLIAGVLGIAGFWIARNTPKPSTLWSSTTFFASL